MILEVAEVHVSVYGCAKERERTYACVCACVQGFVDAIVCVCARVCVYASVCIHGRGVRVCVHERVHVSVDAQADNVCTC